LTLRSTIATPEGKRRYVRRLFATIADRYDFITRLLSYGQDRRWKRRLIDLARLRPEDRVLDLACGTGDLLFAAAPRVRYAVGLDLTHRMLQLADRRAAKARPTRADPAIVARHTRADADTVAHPSSLEPEIAGRPFTGRRNVAFVTGDMLALPLAGARFDVITTGYGLRNVPDLAVALSEMHRVLAPGGRLLSLDFNRPGNAVVRAAYLAYLTGVGSVLGLVLHGDPSTYRYIPESIRLYPGATGVARMMVDAGFTEVRVVPVFGGLMAIHTARRPKPKA
jgi:demethylmenaquinone methyltransferase/2-methoxy-6-polyprenyl-1,4-benzoquinol methylase